MNKKLDGKIAFITGASSGIGEATARIFAENGAKLILLARRIERLNSLAEEFKKEYNTESYLIGADVRDFSKLQMEFKKIPQEFRDISILVNNAGLARGLEKIYEGNVQDWEEMIDTNIKGLLYVTKLVSPIFLEKNSGHIVNIASLAGRAVYPNGNVYCATKYAVKALSEAMVIDFNGTNIRITNIDPGLVETEFSEVRFHGDKERAKRVYQGYKPLTGYDIANIILFCVTLPEHVMIQDLLVTPTAQATATIVSKNL
ncbi:SDR family NAD(P)-dependent oxidoreductase [Bacteroidetes/Chlorobi group bacterium Naka2016]|jgi:serine 3-dehydrogenase|nr:MAG: SDR family NAD(P)-dependent oxidoreductase [Bacteroidetes/Chlorobi group bacterium Naka2016]